MLFDKINSFFGLFIIRIYSLLYFNRFLAGKNIKIKKNFRFIIDKKSKIIIGDNFRGKYNVNFNSLNGGKIIIGDNVFINDNAILTSMGKIIIGNNVLIGHNFFVIDHDHDYKDNIKNFVISDVKIGNNVWIGANVTILKGVTIGDNSVLAANSLITKDVPAFSIVKGTNQIYSKKGR